VKATQVWREERERGGRMWDEMFTRCPSRTFERGEAGKLVRLQRGREKGRERTLPGSWQRDRQQTERDGKRESTARWKQSTCSENYSGAGKAHRSLHEQSSGKTDRDKEREGESETDGKVHSAEREEKG